MSNSIAFLNDANKVQRLQHINSLLHIFHHRNKNQHRHSIWWRHFCTFRRQLNHLTEDVITLTTEATTHVERARLKAKAPQLRERVSQRLEFWQSVCVSKWHRAFSQLAADGRFATLGLVLIACLSEVCAITGVTAMLDALGESEVQRVLAKFGHEQWSVADQARTTERQQADDQGDAKHEDAGVVISRQSITDKQRSSSKDAPSMLGESKIKNVADVVRRKKRKKGNAIDDLFDGL